MNGGLSYDYTFGKHAINAQAFIRTYQNVIRGQESSNRYLSYNEMCIRDSSGTNQSTTYKLYM